MNLIWQKKKNLREVGNTFAVAGGNYGINITNTVELLDVEIFTWSVGPEMPLEIMDAAYEIYQDNPLVIGGESRQEEVSK